MEQDTSTSTLVMGIVSLVLSLTAIIWNIVRDLILDRVNLKVGVALGRMFPVETLPGRFLFASVSEPFTRKSKRPLVVYFTVTNIGRRPVVIEKIGAKYKNKPSSQYWLLTTRTLPKALEPYHELSEYANDLSIIHELRAGEYDYLFASDTKGKRWKISSKNIKELLEQSNLVELPSDGINGPTQPDDVPSTQTSSETSAASETRSSLQR